MVLARETPVSRLDARVAQTRAIARWAPDSVSADLSVLKQTCRHAPGAAKRAPMERA